MKRKTSKILAGILAILMVLGLLVSLIPGRAYAVTQHDMDVLAVERDELRAKRAEQQELIDQLEADKASALERKLAMDERTAYNEQQIKLNNEQLALYDEMIADKAAEVDAARALEAEQLERYRVRVRAMEENGGYDFLALVLNTTTLGELLTTMDDMGEIMQSDRELEDAYIAAREHTEQVKADYESYKADLEAKQEEIRAEQIELQRQIQEALDLVAEIENDIAGHEEDIEALRQQEAEVQADINAIFAELEAERKAREEEQRRLQEEAAQNGTTVTQTYNVVTGTGSFGWPLPGWYYVTSRAGNRYHPIFGEWRYHSGMDIAADAGAAIVASDGGTVCYCDVKGGYGNCVMIDHGNGYYTLYGHMSSFACYYGKTVSKGDTIGYVGSTGWATGPHLHFEIRSGDTPIEDIEGFAGFSGLSYSPDAGE